VEHKLDQAVESSISVGGDPELLAIGDVMETNVDEAVSRLKAYVETHPDSVDAYLLLQRAYLKKNEIPASQEAALKLCSLHLKNRDTEAALQDYQDFLNSGGKDVPVALWLDLCRAAESKQDFERAVQEYERLATVYAKERQAIVAQMNAARLYMGKLNRPQDALRLYESVSQSPVPHLDFDQAIERGKREALQAMSATVGATSEAMHV
jgi:tetratricopeptide (TPR) repeat protein